MKKTEDESDEDLPVTQSEKSDNPWLGGSASVSRESSEITSGYRKLWNKVNESKKIRQEMNDGSPVSKEPISDSDEEETASPTPAAANDDEERQNNLAEELDEGLLRRSTIEDFSDMPEVSSKKANKKPKSELTKSGKISLIGKKEVTCSNIDPNKYVTMTAAVELKSSVPVSEQAGEEEDEEEQAVNQRRMTLAEAFADDDVVDQFVEEKKKVIDANNPKDIDLTLPGWGDWGGTGLKVSKRKKKLFVIKAPPAPNRRDQNKGHLIINEDKCVSMRRQQVTFSIFNISLPCYFNLIFSITFDHRLMICLSLSNQLQRLNPL